MLRQRKFKHCDLGRTDCACCPANGMGSAIANAPVPVAATEFTSICHQVRVDFLNMSALNQLLHLVNFVLPALCLAVLLPASDRFILRNRAARPMDVGHIATIFIVGLATLLAGLWWLGRDGKMVTYAAMVVLCASCQWLLARSKGALRRRP